MANLALGKLPLETVWAHPEEATNGKTVGYTGDKGFTDANFPATYTLDLGEITPIYMIRFLLWDGINDANRRTEDKRQYFYSLSLSDDNILWDTYFTTLEKGFNGWQVFRFDPTIRAKFVRLYAKHNTENKGFHIVEFEVHNSPPPALTGSSKITNNRFLSSPMAPENFILENYDDLLKKSQETFVKESNEILNKIKADAKAAEGLKKELSDIIGEFNFETQQLRISGKSRDFLEEATNIKKISQKWLAATAISFGLFLILIFCFLFCGNYSFRTISFIISHSRINKGLINETVLFEFASYLVLKALLVSLSIYAIVFCAKNYRTQMHNYTINQHKAMSLSASTQLLGDNTLTPQVRETILVQATTTIFAHQNSGYNTKDGDVNPSILSALIDKIK